MNDAGLWALRGKTQELLLLQFAARRNVDKIPAGSPLQDAQCNFSWFFAAHNL